MSALVKMPNLNAFHFVHQGVEPYFFQSLPDFIIRKQYWQKVQVGDNFRIQMLCTADNLTTATAKLINKNGSVYHTYTFASLSLTSDGYTGYEVTGAMPSIPEGYYTWQLTIPVDTGINLILYSEPLWIKVAHENTILITYYNSVSQFGMFFPSSHTHSLRIEGGVLPSNFTPQAKVTMYEDLNYVPQITYAVPYNTFKFSFGPSDGIPNWMVDKLNRIFLLSYFDFDGTQYIRAESSQLERSGDSLHPMAGWVMPFMLPLNPLQEDKYETLSGETVKIPDLNSFQFVNPETEEFYTDSLPDFLYKKTYLQKVQVCDPFRIQIQTTNVAMTTATAQLVDYWGKAYATWYFAYMGFGSENYNGYEASGNIPLLPDGIYVWKLWIPFGSYSLTLYSEPVLVKSSHPNTVLIQYNNGVLHNYGMYFTNADNYHYLRIEGGVLPTGFGPSSKTTMYEDQNQKPVIIYSMPFNVYKFSFGPADGLPNWMADKLNRIFVLSSTYFDGVNYILNEGAKLERSGDTLYDLAGWTVDFLLASNEMAELKKVEPITFDLTRFHFDNSYITFDMTHI